MNSQGRYRNSSFIMFDGASDEDDGEDEDELADMFPFELDDKENVSNNYCQLI